MPNNSAITVRQNPERHRYELLDGDKVIGKAHWMPFEGGTGPERIFFHTTVDDEYGGQGLAGTLVHFALENTAAEGLKVVPVCPYVKVYLRKHPQFQQHAVPVSHEHIAAVNPA